MDMDTQAVLQRLARAFALDSNPLWGNLFSMLKAIDETKRLAAAEPYDPIETQDIDSLLDRAIRTADSMLLRHDY